MSDLHGRVHAAGVAAVPVVVVGVGLALMGMGNRDMLVFWSVVGIGLLAALLVGAFRYYAAHPVAGLLTAVCLAGMFPASQAAMGSDFMQMVLGVLSGGVGAVLVAVFAGLTVVDMRASVGEGVAARGRRSTGSDS